MRLEDLVPNTVYYDTKNKQRIVFESLSANRDLAMVHGDNNSDIINTYSLSSFFISEIGAVNGYYKDVVVFNRGRCDISDIIGKVNISSENLPSNFVLVPAFVMDGDKLSLIEFSVMPLPPESFITSHKKEIRYTEFETKKVLNAIATLDVKDSA